MDIEHDPVALARANLSCSQRMQNFTPKEGVCNITWDGIMCWDATPAGYMTKLPCPSYVKDTIKTGFASRLCGPDGKWLHWDPYDNSSNGWTNYSDCFREDPTFASIKNDLARINMMTNIGYAISLVSLLVAVLIMLVSRRLHCKSNSLHINLFMAFILRAVISLLKDVLFVDGLGLEKDVNRLSTNKVDFRKDGGTHWECKLIVSVFMYAVSASMMWIFMEGLYLHMLVYKTLFVERNGVRMYVVLGWLTPFLYVIPWILVRIYDEDTFCWNNDANGYLWIIVAPIIFTIAINFGFFINIVRVLCARMKSHRTMSMTGSNQQVRKLAKFALVLIPLFGVLYIGTSAYPVGVNTKADMIYLYWEMFYNSFQGFVLAVLFCFLNEEVHNEIRRCWNRQRRHDSVFTRTFSLSTYRSKHVSHNSIHDPKRVNKQSSYRNDLTSISEQPSEHVDSSTFKSRNGASKSVHYQTGEQLEQICPLVD